MQGAEDGAGKGIKRGEKGNKHGILANVNFLAPVEGLDPTAQPHQRKVNCRNNGHSPWVVTQISGLGKDKLIHTKVNIGDVFEQRKQSHKGNEDRKNLNRSKGRGHSAKCKQDQDYSDEEEANSRVGYHGHVVLRKQ